MIRSVLALVLLLFAVPAAMPASFDCARASTPFERAICEDPELSEADEVLAQAYATALGGLSEAAAVEVKGAQRSWLNHAQRVCSDDAEPIAGHYSDEQKQCLAGVIRARVRGLESSRMEGGFRFYPVQRFLVEKDTEADPDDFNKVAVKEFTTVKIDRDNAVAAAFNAAIDELMAGQGKFFEPGTTQIAAGDVTSDYDISTRVSAISSHRITLDSTEYWYGHGAAHGSYTLWHQHFLIEPRRMLEASDIFSADGWPEKLAELSLARLEDQLGEGMWDDLELEDVADWVADPQRWDFSEAGLLVQFQIYEVTAYAAGAPVVTIPWDELEELLAPDAVKIATWGLPY